MRPGMLYGKVLRPPSYGEKLASIDLEPARQMKDVTVVQDGAFVGVAAPTSHQARQALAALAKAAKWEQPAQQASSDTLYADLKAHVQGGAVVNPFAEDAVKSA